MKKVKILVAIFALSFFISHLIAEHRDFGIRQYDSDGYHWRDPIELKFWSDIYNIISMTMIGSMIGLVVILSLDDRVRIASDPVIHLKENKEALSGK